MFHSFYIIQQSLQYLIFMSMTINTFKYIVRLEHDVAEHFNTAGTQTGVINDLITPYPGQVTYMQLQNLHV